MGIGKAKEMIFTAKVIGGQEALEIGLVEHVVQQNDDSNAAYLKALDIAKEIQSKVCMSLSGHTQKKKKLTSEGRPLSIYL